MEACAARAAPPAASQDQPTEPAASLLTAPATAPPTDRRPRRSSTGLWLAGGGALVLGGAAFFWVRAWDADRRIDDRIEGGGTWDPSWEALESRRSGDQTIAQIATGVGIAAVAGGLVYHLAIAGRPARVTARMEQGGGAVLLVARDL
jgi:hypothetical protein